MVRDEETGVDAALVCIASAQPNNSPTTRIAQLLSQAAPLPSQDKTPKPPKLQPGAVHRRCCNGELASFRTSPHPPTL